MKLSPLVKVVGWVKEIFINNYLYQEMVILYSKFRPKLGILP